MEFDKYISKLKKIVRDCIEKRSLETALIAAKTLSNIYYNYNQIYTDTELENDLLQIRDMLLQKQEYIADKNCVLFYDGFGLDLRGIAVVYARALARLSYKVIYVCPETMNGKIPHIISEFNSNNTQIIYVNKEISNIERIKQINSIFRNYRPKVAFFYTYPSDVEGAIAFSNNNSSTRIQLDLTDHAYWIGVNAFDYIVNGREMGASIAHYERGIPKERIIKLDCTPYINRDKCDKLLPFDIKSEKYIFTGGSLYKTLGDDNLLYYKAIDNILLNFHDIKFLYAGSGNDTEIQKLITKYPGRAFLVDERPDFYELIVSCVLYINSYPMFGGLMMRYAALAGKIPITLKHGNDADGILINQEHLGIEYECFDDFIAEIYKLLSDNEYREKKEHMLIGAVMTEEDFARNLEMLIELHRTEFSFDKIRRFDTTELRSEYKKRYTNKCLYRDMVKKSNIKLFQYFPREFVLGELNKTKERLFK